MEQTSETSREVVSANSKVADSTAYVSETQNPMLLAEAEVISLASGLPNLTPNAGFTNLIVSASTNLTILQCSAGFSAKQKGDPHSSLHYHLNVLNISADSELPLPVSVSFR